MKKADVIKEMSYVQSMYVGQNIEYNIDRSLLFVHFRNGAITCPYRQLSAIFVNENEVRLILKCNINFIWRSTSGQIWCVCYG